MDIWNPLPQLEAAFYRRVVDDNNTNHTLQYSYHNHILIGCNLFFIQKPLKPKDVGKFRLVLVQGTRQGRLKGIKLSMESKLRFEVLPTPIIDNHNAYKSSNPPKYCIEITGHRHMDNELEKWQIITSSEQVYHEWMEQLKKARHFADISEASGEMEKLKELTKKLKDGLVIRQRLSRFKLYTRTFVGIRAVKWIMQEKQCNITQALAIGNKLLNLGFVHHVTYEHLFNPRHLLYRFSYEIEHYHHHMIDDTHGLDTVDHNAWDDMINENHRLLASYHTTQRQHIALKTQFFQTTIFLLIASAYNALQAKQYETKLNTLTQHPLKLLQQLQYMLGALFVLIIFISLGVSSICSTLPIYHPWHTILFLFITTLFLLVVACRYVVKKVQTVLRVSLITAAKAMQTVNTEQVQQLNSYASTEEDPQVAEERRLGKLVQDIQDHLLSTLYHTDWQDELQTYLLNSTVLVNVPDNVRELLSLNAKVKSSIGVSTIATGKTAVSSALHQQRNPNNVQSRSQSSQNSPNVHSGTSRSGEEEEDEEEEDDEEDDRSDHDETMGTLFDDVALMISSEGEGEEDEYGEDKEGEGTIDSEDRMDRTAAITASAKRRRSSAQAMNEVLLGDAETVRKRMKETQMKRQSLTSSNVYMTSDEQEDGEDEEEYEEAVRDDEDEEDGYHTKLQSSREIGSEDDEMMDRALTPSERKRKSATKKIMQASHMTTSLGVNTPSTAVHEVTPATSSATTTRSKLSTSLRNTLRKSITLGRRSSATTTSTPASDLRTSSAAAGAGEEDGKRRNSLPTSPFSAIHYSNHPSATISATNHQVSASYITSLFPGPAAASSMLPNQVLTLSNPEYLHAMSSRHTLQTHANTMSWPSYPILVKRSLSMLGSQYFSTSPLSSPGGTTGIAAITTENTMTLFDREEIQAQLLPLRVHNLAHPEQQLIPIQNDYFTGNAFFMFNHISQANQLYFEDRKRQQYYVIQGRFTQSFPFTHLYSGQFSTEPLQQRPTSWLFSSLTKLQPGFQTNLATNTPYFLSPLFAVAQTIIISEPGKEPDIFSCYQVENDELSLLSPPIPSSFLSAHQPKNIRKRRLYFAQRGNLEKYHTNPNYVYTFIFHQNVFNFSNFQLELSLFKYDVIKLLGTLPVRIMTMFWDPIGSKGVIPLTQPLPCLYHFEIYHHRQVALLQQPLQQQQSPPQSGGVPVDSTGEEMMMEGGRSISQEHSPPVLPPPPSVAGNTPTTTPTMMKQKRFSLPTRLRLGGSGGTSSATASSTSANNSGGGVSLIPGHSTTETGIVSTGDSSSTGGTSGGGGGQEIIDEKEERDDGRKSRYSSTGTPPTIIPPTTISSATTGTTTGVTSGTGITVPAVIDGISVRAGITFDEQDNIIVLPPPTLSPSIQPTTHNIIVTGNTGITGSAASQESVVEVQPPSPMPTSSPSTSFFRRKQSIPNSTNTVAGSSAGTGTGTSSGENTPARRKTWLGKVVNG